jgi:uncharacterized membrane protein YsdA (DUF1294 family)
LAALSPWVPAASTGFLLLQGLLTSLGLTSALWPGWYATWSLLTLLVYGWDKRQACNHGRRVPERQLHILALLGGWPGAGLAQSWWRHKTRKQPFRRVFIAIMGLHGLAWVWWFVGMRPG